MSEADQLKGTPFDVTPGNKKIPGSLNTLTILTFIGSGILLFLTILNIFTAEKGLEQLEKMQGSEQLEKMPKFFQNFYSPEALEIARKSYENRIPLIILSLVGLGLCVGGAIQMRALKKEGYYFWILGNILPLVGTAIFIGMAALTGGPSIFMLCITLLFFILYTRQLKHLR
jgi:hypothetical protein